MRPCSLLAALVEWRGRGAMPSTLRARGTSRVLALSIAACGCVAMLPAFTVAQETTRVSVDSSGAEGNLGSSTVYVAANGFVVAFQSDASNLIAADTNHFGDVFVHDRTTGITERVSLDSSGREANGFSYATSISATGRWVAFTS